MSHGPKIVKYRETIEGIQRDQKAREKLEREQTENKQRQDRELKENNKRIVREL